MPDQMLVIAHKEMSIPIVGDVECLAGIIKACWIADLDDPSVWVYDAPGARLLPRELDVTSNGFGRYTVTVALPNGAWVSAPFTVGNI